MNHHGTGFHFEMAKTQSFSIRQFDKSQQLLNDIQLVDVQTYHQNKGSSPDSRLFHMKFIILNDLRGENMHNLIQYLLYERAMEHNMRVSCGNEEEPAELQKAVDIEQVGTTLTPEEPIQHGDGKCPPSSSKSFLDMTYYSSGKIRSTHFHSFKFILHYYLFYINAIYFLGYCNSGRRRSITGRARFAKRTVEKHQPGYLF